jgi:hypothetical protein
VAVGTALDPINLGDELASGALLLSNYASLSAAVTAIGATETTLVIDADDTITANLTMPITLQLDHLIGNVLTISSGVTLTYNKPPIAGRYKLWTFSGTGVVAGKLGDAKIEWFGAVADGARSGASRGAGTGTDSSTVIQVAYNYVRDNSGCLDFQPHGIYRCDTALTLLSNANPANYYDLRFNNCVFDFTNLTGSAIAMKFGATSLATSHDQEKVSVGPFIMYGPEGVGKPETPTTTTTGLYLSYCIGWTFEPYSITAFYYGVQGQWAWAFEKRNAYIWQNFIGILLHDACTVGLWNAPQIVENVFGVLLRPSSSATSVISGQTFNGARLEGNDVHVHMDSDQMTSTTYGVRDICFVHPYLESATYDAFRIGLDWDADPSVRGADNSTNYTGNVRVIGGIWNNNAWTSTSKPFVFPASSNKVEGFVFNGAVRWEDVVGRPRKFSWCEDQVNNQYRATHQQLSFNPGEGWCQFDANGSITTNKLAGNISSITYVSTGTVDVNFHEAYSATDEYIVTGTSNGRLICVDTGASTVSKARVLIYDFAGTLDDAGGLKIKVEGTLA